MLIFKNCAEVEKKDIYQVFIGSLDKSSKLKDMKIEDFFNRFFIILGSKLKYSYILYKDGLGIGLILVGIREENSLRIMKFTNYIVSGLEERDKVEDELLEKVRQVSLAYECNLLFTQAKEKDQARLEKLYRLGFNRVYTRESYYLDTWKFNHKRYLDYKFIRMDLRRLEEFKDKTKQIPIGWENSFDSLRYMDNLQTYGVIKDKDLVGGLAIDQNYHIKYIYVLEEYRKEGLGTRLISEALLMKNDYKGEKLYISFINNLTLGGFIYKKGFKKINRPQYQLYLPV